MSDAELEGFLAEQRIVVVATTGRDGRPHMTALWYALRDGEPWIYTYGSSQKTRNLERVPQATLLIEAGEHYHELRGVSIYADATIHRDPTVVGAVGVALAERYQPPGSPPLDEAGRQAVIARAAKRVAIQFSPTRVISWDHGKLGGLY